MGAVIFSRSQIVGFVLVTTGVLGVTMAIPEPYPVGYGVERHTGAPQPDAWHRLAEARGTGDALAALAPLRELAREFGDASMIVRSERLLRGEIAAPLLEDIGTVPSTPGALAQKLREACLDRVGDRVERFFLGVPLGGLGAIDARAAVLRSRLDKQGDLPLGEMLAIANEYGRRGRLRAQWRWLLRAFEAHPDSAAAGDGLVAIYVALGKLEQALAVMDIGLADRRSDVAFHRQRAQLGAWMSRPEVEAGALEQLVQLEKDPAYRGRLVEIYTWLGAHERALPHAMALVEGAAEIAEAETAARSAFSAGYVDEGLRMLQRAASRAADPTPWLRRLADYALQDLRVDRVERELERVRQFDIEGDEAALEMLYRTTDQPEKLADLLQQRLAKTPGDGRLWNEVISLRFGLGQRVAGRHLREQQRIAMVDPERFVSQLPPDLRAEAAALRRQALSLALAGEVSGTILGDILDRLSPYLVHPEFRSVAETLLARYPDDPRSKPLRIELVDRARTAKESLAAAKALAGDYPDDLELVEMWIERAGWAELPRAQIEARLAWFSLRPGDLDNIFELADLYDFVGDRSSALPHWRTIVENEGVASRAVPRLIDDLFSCDEEGEAIAWLQRLADDDRATVLQRLQAAEELFYRHSYDRAQRCTQPSWPTPVSTRWRCCDSGRSTLGPTTRAPLDPTSNAGCAPRTRTRRSFVSIWARPCGRPVNRRERGSCSSRRSRRCSGIESPDFTKRSLMATMLARLGERAAAAEAFRELVAESPRELDLVLDYVDVLIAAGDFATAEAVLDHARALSPENERLLAMEAANLSRRGDLAGAAAAYERAIALHGIDAGLASDLGQVQYASGDWQGALASFDRWQMLQSESIAARRSSGDLRDLLASAAIGQVRSLRIGDDRLLEVTGSVVLPFDQDLRLQARVGTGHYEGRAAASGGAVVSTDVGILDVKLEGRSQRFNRWGIGISAAPGAEGNIPVGAYGNLYVQRADPFASLQLRVAYNELWTEPAAAAGLGGRRSGVTAQSYLDLGKGVWTSSSLSVERLGIDPDGSEMTRDTRVRGEVSAGWRFVDGDVGAASRFRIGDVPAGPMSPFLDAEPGDTRAWLGNVWLAYQAASLQGDAALVRQVPIAEIDEQLFVAARLDRHLARGLGISIAGQTGQALRTSGGIWGVEGALTWRPSFGNEFTVAASHGSVLGRSGGGDVDELRLEVVFRW